MTLKRVACCLLCLLLSALAHAGLTERVSLTSAGEEANDSSGVLTYLSAASVTPDGRYVVFTSCATNLVTGKARHAGDVYVRDRVTGETECVSLTPGGAPGNQCAIGGSISDDGRYVAFYAHSSDLVPGDTNGRYDVFLRDRTMGTTTRVSVSTGGEEAKGDSFGGAVSADGRFVFYYSFANNLVPAAPDDGIYVRDTALNTTELLWPYGGSFAVSGDGRFVAFQSSRDDLVPWDTNSCDDVFLGDTVLGTVERVSVGTYGEQANGDSDYPSVSDDGRYVAFVSVAGNLLPGDTNGYADIFLRDRLLGRTTRINVSADGVQANAESGAPVLSRNGNCVVYWSGATSLSPAHTGWWEDVFVCDAETGVSDMISVSNSGEQGNAASDSGCPSADGRFVVFNSTASNLVPGDTNGVEDVFIRQRETFLDVPLAHWAYHAVEACCDAGIVAGYDDGLYRPASSVTRDQMAVYIARALVSPSGDASIPQPEPPPSFSDVPLDHWAYKHIEYVVSQNVVQGYRDGTYGPGVAVDRGQMAVYVARAMVAPGGDAAIPDPVPPATFPDVPDTYWAYKQVEYCVGQGVVKGYDDGYYHPDYPVTRDQMAVYIARAFGLL